MDQALITSSQLHDLGTRTTSQHAVCSIHTWVGGCRSTRAAAAAALAVLATSPSGRDAARVSGALPLLVLMLDEGPHSLAAEQAAKALMNAAVSDVSKVCPMCRLCRWRLVCSNHQCFTHYL